MNQLVPIRGARTPSTAHPRRRGLDVPTAIAGAGDTAVRRFLEFFAATIRNKNTRMAYYRAVTDGVELCESLVRLLPERDPVGHRGRHQDRAKTSNMLLTDVAISPPRRLDDAGLQPMPALMAKSDKHGSGTMAGPSQTNLPLQPHDRSHTPFHGKSPAPSRQPVPGIPPVSKISSSSNFRAITHAGSTPAPVPAQGFRTSNTSATSPSGIPDQNFFSRREDQRN
jgi:hypothetical protein